MNRNFVVSLAAMLPVGSSASWAADDGAHFRLVDTFRFWAYRISETFDSVETDWTCTDTSTCSLLTPIGGTTQSATISFMQLSFNQSWKRNQVDFAWDASKHFGSRIGFPTSESTTFDPLMQRCKSCERQTP